MHLLITLYQILEHYDTIMFKSFYFSNENSDTTYRCPSKECNDMVNFLIIVHTTSIY